MALRPADVRFLEECVDRILAIELNTGEQFFAEVVLVVDEPPTPDVLLLRMNREPDGTFTPLTTSGESILLADISRIAPLPGIRYPEPEDEDEATGKPVIH